MKRDFEESGMSTIRQRAFILLEPLLIRFKYSLPFLNLFLHVFGRALNVDVFLIRGRIKNTSYLATTLFVGPENGAYELADLVYVDSLKIVALGKSMFFKADALRFSRVDIVGICADWPGILDRGYLFLPYVKFSLDLTPSLEDILGKCSKRRRRDIKKTKNSGFSYTISIDSESDFDFFYWKMYVPYVLNRFGKAGAIRAYSTAKLQHDSEGGIIFVKMENAPVAGILFRMRGETIYALLSGTWEGDYSFVKKLAGQAALFFLVEWAKSQGIKKLDYGAAMPFFSDGVFSYKKEWGMFVEKTPDAIFCALKIEPRMEAFSFLQQNPFIFVDKGAISGAVLVDHRPTDEELQKIFRNYYFPRMDSLIVVAYYAPRLSVTDANRSSSFHENPVVKPLQHICSSLMKTGFNVETHILPSENAKKTT